MKSVHVSPRSSAIRDAETAIDYYIGEAGEAVAYRFIEALRATYELIGDAPGIGSPRLGSALGIESLRTFPVRGFPYVVCYEVLPGGVEVLRLLHAQRDIPKHLASMEN